MLEKKWLVMPNIQKQDLDKFPEINPIVLQLLFNRNIKNQQEIDDLKKLVEIDKYLDLDKLKDVRLYKGRGCDKCNNTGYAGRLGIFEVLAIEETMRSLIADRADSDKIRAQAQKLGMTTMMEDGFDKVVSGQTTLEEILRVTRQ